MKKLLVLTGIVIFATSINQTCQAQIGPVTVTPPETAVVDSGSGSLRTNKAISVAETERAVQEARKMKALKAAMADKSYQHRLPVAHNASQFLELNRPPASAAPAEIESPYLVPRAYPRTDVPAFKPAKKVPASTGDNAPSGNPYTYPGRVSEGNVSDSTPENPTLANSTDSELPKKRPNFFKWLKQRKNTTTGEGPQIGNTTAASSPFAPAPEVTGNIKNEAEEKVMEIATTSTARSVPVPPPSATATPVRPSPSATATPAHYPAATAIPASPAATGSPANQPSAMAKPSTTKDSGNTGGGLFGKLFSKPGRSNSSRTISSDPAQSEAIELLRN